MLRFLSVFASVFFLSINFGAVLYVNSTLLRQHFDTETTSALFVLGAVGNILLFLITPKLIEIFGKRFLLLAFLFVLALSTLTLGLSSDPSVVATAFLAYSNVFFIIYYVFDIFLEEVSRDKKTGETRGLYMSVINLGILLGPFILSRISADENLAPVYLAAALAVLPAILISIFDLHSRSQKWHGLHKHHALLPLRLWWRTKSLRRSTIAKFVLEIFFGIMVVYVPIYLHENIGFQWQELGVMFTIMLLPFVILEWPAGKLADHFIGEKEMLILGFILMAGSLAVMPVLGKTFVAWTTILLVSRIGASLVEVMTDSYFFKHVSGEDIRLISIFRLVRPAGIIAGTIIGAVAITFLPIEMMFLILIAVVFAGLKSALALRDTL